MSKIQIPAEYKAFEDKFSALAYGQDDSKVFDDMLTFIIDLFSFDNPWKPHGRYKDLEIRKRFFELFQEIVLLMNKKVRDDGEWYDPFGNLYETQMAGVQTLASFLLQRILLILWFPSIVVDGI